MDISEEIRQTISLRIWRRSNEAFAITKLAKDKIKENVEKRRRLNVEVRKRQQGIRLARKTSEEEERAIGKEGKE